MSEYVLYLSHHGVKGMKWGHRKEPNELAGYLRKEKIKAKSDLKNVKRDIRAFNKKVGSRRYQMPRNPDIDTLTALARRAKEIRNAPSVKSRVNSLKLDRRIYTKLAQRSMKKVEKYSKKLEKTRIKKDWNPVYEHRRERLEVHLKKLKHRTDMIPAIDGLIKADGKLTTYVKQNTIDKGRDYVEKLLAGDN